jgi:hypothetical protein
MRLVAWGQPLREWHQPVEHIEVEPGEHALARPASREGAPSSHHHVQHGEGDEILLLQERDSRLSAKGSLASWGTPDPC